MKSESEPTMESSSTPRRRLYTKAALAVLVAVVVALGVTKITSYQKEVPLPVLADSVSNSALVTVDANGFIPATITIKKGTTVTWQNTDSDTYSQIIADLSPTSSDSQLPGFSSPIMNADGTYSYTFSEAGAFTYHDAINELSGGKVIVLQ